MSDLLSSHMVLIVRDGQKYIKMYFNTKYKIPLE